MTSEEDERIAFFDFQPLGIVTSFYTLLSFFIAFKNIANFTPKRVIKNAIEFSEATWM